MFHRRNFLSAVGAAGLIGLSRLSADDKIVQPHAAPAAQSPKKKVAIVTTVWGYLTHAQHMGDRLLVGYPLHGKWHTPQVQVVSAFVDQKPDYDLSAKRGADHGFTVYSTIAEALRCGGDKLAVDGIVIIGEHGEYPENEKGQILYPRFEFFQEAVKVFEQDGRAVPIFNDKHLSYSWEKAAKMVADSERLQFPFLAGSSLPVTWRNPSVDVPYGAEVKESLAVANGPVDSMGFHLLEAMQCMIERRKGGETGIKSVQLIEGDEVWRAGEDGRWSKRLLEAALSRSDSLHGDSELDSRPQDLVHNGKLASLIESDSTAKAVLIEYNDGLQASMLMLDGVLGDFNVAVRLGNNQVVSTQFYLPPEPNVAYSARLMAQAEEMIVTGKAPYPVRRTQLTSALLDRALQSKLDGYQRIATPELNITYQAPREHRFGG
ncbi:MAG: hypothetical protein O2931_02025 [Planctomycetota bacterium]|nr:hypothetical protein [Planctomycetota bacterium]MDA1177551.1 hypothetical protein [Planctomycetota bacterium]